MRFADTAGTEEQDVLRLIDPVSLLRQRNNLRFVDAGAGLKIKLTELLGRRQLRLAQIALQFFLIT